MKSKTNTATVTGRNRITKALALAQNIEKIRIDDPDHYSRIMRKLAQLERRVRVK